jgi:hypothetical protein
MRLETNLSKHGQKVRNRGLFRNGVPPSARAKSSRPPELLFTRPQRAQHIHREQRRERVSKQASSQRARVSKQWRIHFYIINSLMLIWTTTAKMLPRRTSLWVNLWVHNLNCRSSYHLQDVLLRAIYIHTYVIPCARQRRATERAHIIANNSAHFAADFFRYQFSLGPKSAASLLFNRLVLSGKQCFNPIPFPGNLVWVDSGKGVLKMLRYIT